MSKILLIQTAFIGDVILATSALESIHAEFPDAEIHMLVRKGNEGLLEGHPFLKKVWVWNKNEGKYKNLIRLSKEIRSEKFDTVINFHRFASSAFVATRSRAKLKAGFDKSPLSGFYQVKVKHEIGNGLHEVERNHQLVLAAFGQSFEMKKPRLYPTDESYAKITAHKDQSYLVMAPSSVWLTKQLPKEKWVELIQQKSDKLVLLIGGSGDFDLLEDIRTSAGGSNVENLAGKLNLLDSAALISRAERTYVNDSAPLHLASAMNAPVTAFFCSTIPDFGFGPLSDDNKIVQSNVDLVCRPCGLHGKSSCPKGHFDCGNTIDVVSE